MPNQKAEVAEAYRVLAPQHWSSTWDLAVGVRLEPRLGGQQTIDRTPKNLVDACLVGASLQRQSGCSEPFPQRNSSDRGGTWANGFLGLSQEPNFLLGAAVFLEFQRGHAESGNAGGRRLPTGSKVYKKATRPGFDRLSCLACVLGGPVVFASTLPVATGVTRPTPPPEAGPAAAGLAGGGAAEEPRLSAEVAPGQGRATEQWRVPRGSSGMFYYSSRGTFHFHSFQGSFFLTAGF